MAIRAPLDGTVGEVGVKLGQYVTPGTQLVALVPQDVWIVANFKERQTSAMKPGQSAAFTVDALGDTYLNGIVECTAPATTAEFSVLQPDNGTGTGTGTGNFTKIPQRLAVRIRISPDRPLTSWLRPHMFFVVHVDTASSTGVQLWQTKRQYRPHAALY